MHQPVDEAASRILRSATCPSGQTASGLVITAEGIMREALHPSVFNHTMRVLHLAWHLSDHRIPVDQEALAIAVLFHDSGTAAGNNGRQRFEIEGADAAVRFLEDWGWSPERTRPVWNAIALHTSAGIAERFGALAGLVRTAVLVDLRRTDMPVPATPALDEQLARYPRLQIERVLPDLVVAQALEPGKATKAPAFTWPGALVAEHLAHRSHGS